MTVAVTGGDRILVRIVNGPGPEAAKPAHGLRSGLAGLEERVRMLGWHVSGAPEPGIGFVLTAELPAHLAVINTAPQHAPPEPTADLDAKALREGALGSLLKDTGPAELIRAVRHVAAGESILAPQIPQRLIERHLATPDGTEHARERIGVLTSAETEVLELVGAGMSNSEIAQRLHMGTGTVKAHVSRILTKLDCTNRVQAAILAHDSGLLTDKPR